MPRPSSAVLLASTPGVLLSPEGHSSLAGGSSNLDPSPFCRDVQNIGTNERLSAEPGQGAVVSGVHERVLAGADPNALDPYEPVTFGPWLNAIDDGGFRTRDLIRELKDAPEYGLRVNQFYYDRGFVKQQERMFNYVSASGLCLPA